MSGSNNDFFDWIKVICQYMESGNTLCGDTQLWNLEKITVCVKESVKYIRDGADVVQC